MSEELLVRHGAPTLAGLKTANLFTCPCDSKQDILSFVRRQNSRLQCKGLRMIPLRFSDDKALLYLYRPGKLSADLSNAEAEALLTARGYDLSSCDRCVVQLMRRLRQSQDFPHEIGLFLGYPAEDVRGFIENSAKGCKCVGCWKVYGDEAAARKKFAQYKKCTRVYCQRFAQTHDIERLTVAG